MHIYTYIKHTTTNRIKQPFRAGGARPLLPPLQEKKTFFQKQTVYINKKQHFQKSTCDALPVKKTKKYSANLCK